MIMSYWLAHLPRSTRTGCWTIYCPATLESEHRASCEPGWSLVRLIHTYLSFPLLSKIPLYHPSFPTMLPWLTIIATLVGFASAAAFPRDLGFLTLSQDKITSIDPYSHYSAAVKCGPQALVDWHCGRAYLTSGPPFSYGRKGWV